MILTYSDYPIIDFTGIVNWGSDFVAAAAAIRFYVSLDCINGANIDLSNTKCANMRIEAVRG